MRDDTEVSEESTQEEFRSIYEVIEQLGFEKGFEKGFTAGVDAAREQLVALINKGIVQPTLPDNAPQVMQPIEELDLSERPRNCLKRAGVNTIGELIAKRSDELLLASSNFGQKSLDEVEQQLAKHGLKLADRAEPAKVAPPLDTPIRDLGLSERPSVCLARANIRVLGDLLGQTDHDLLAITMFGQKSLDEVETKLAEWGLKLKPRY